MDTKDLALLDNFGEFGWGIKSIGRGIKKGAKGVGKGVSAGAKGVGTGAKVVGKTAAKGAVAASKLALLPLKYLTVAVRKLGVALCKAPPPLLEQAAVDAGVDRAFVPMFCTAMQSSISFSTAKRLFRPGLKIAVKLAATGAFPPIVPMISIINKIPYVNRFAGADFRDPVLVNAMGTLELLALADYAGCMTDADARTLGLTNTHRKKMQRMLTGTISGAEAAPSAGKTGWIMGLSLAAVTGLGFYLLTRKTRDEDHDVKPA